MLYVYDNHGQRQGEPPSFPAPHNKLYSIELECASCFYYEYISVNWPSPALSGFRCGAIDALLPSGLK